MYSRLDFDNFVVSQPAVAGSHGQCADTADRITIGIPNGATTNNICGTLSGQHSKFSPLHRSIIGGSYKS